MSSFLKSNNTINCIASNQLTLQKKKLFRTARGGVVSNVCGCAEDFTNR